MCKRSYLYAANVKQQGKISTRTTPKIRPGKYLLHTSCTPMCYKTLLVSRE